MMYRKLGFAELAVAVLQVLRENTAYDVYDAVPEDAESPFLFAEVVGKRDSSSKTTWKETFVLHIHCIAKPSRARTEVYQMIQKAEEAMTAPLGAAAGRRVPDTDRNRRTSHAAGRNRRVACRTRI